MRDTISAKDYEPLCEKLIAQFRTLWETLRDTVSFQRSIRGSCTCAITVSASSHYGTSAEAYSTQQAMLQL